MTDSLKLNKHLVVFYFWKSPSFSFDLHINIQKSVYTKTFHRIQFSALPRFSVVMNSGSHYSTCISEHKFCLLFLTRSFRCYITSLTSCRLCGNWKPSSEKKTKILRGNKTCDNRRFFTRIFTLCLCTRHEHYISGANVVVWFRTPHYNKMEAYRRRQ